MMKLDKKTCKKVCALLLTSVLTLPLAGQPSYALGYPEQEKMQEASERYSYSTGLGDFCIKDNETGVEIVLPDETLEKIKHGEKNICVSFGDGEIDFNDDEVNKIRETIMKIETFDNVVVGTSTVSLIPFLLSFGIHIINETKTLSYARETFVQNMSDEEFEKECEKHKDDKKYIKMMQKYRKNM